MTATTREQKARKRQPSMSTTHAALERHRALSEELGSDGLALPLGDVHEGLLDAAADPGLRPAIVAHIEAASVRRAGEVSKVKAENGRKGGWNARKRRLEQEGKTDAE